MTSRSDTPVLLRGVSKRYGSTTAVDGLDLDVQRAEILALLGPNGAGKTTTVEMCEGFIRPDSGTIEILGLDPVADNARLSVRAYPLGSPAILLGIIVTHQLASSTPSDAPAIPQFRARCDPNPLTRRTYE